MHLPMIPIARRPNPWQQRRFAFPNSQKSWASQTKRLSICLSRWVFPSRRSRRQWKMHKPTEFVVAQSAMASFATPNLKKKSPPKRQRPRRLLQRKRLQHQRVTQLTVLQKSQLRKRQPRRLLQRKPLPKRRHQNLLIQRLPHQSPKLLLQRQRHQSPTLSRLRLLLLLNQKHHSQNRSDLPLLTKVA